MTEGTYDSEIRVCTWTYFTTVLNSQPPTVQRSFARALAGDLPGAILPRERGHPRIAGGNIAIKVDE